MLLNLLRRFLNRENGNVALIVTIAMFPMCLSAGMAIDLVRAHLAKTSLQQAIDAAGLAAGTDTDTTAAQVLTMAQAYLDVNAQGLVINAPETTISVTESGGVKTLDISASAELETTFMKLIHIDSLDVAIDTTIQRKEAGPLHVALVLDVTDSMNAVPSSGGSQTKIQTLRTAATSLVNDLMTTANPQAQIAVVPYAGGVRLYTSTEVSASGFSPPSWIKTQTNTSTCSAWVQNPATRAACIAGGGPSQCVRDGIMRNDVNCCPWVCSNPVTRVYNFVGCVGPRVLNNDGSYTTSFLRTINNPTNPPYPGVAENMWNCAGNGSKVLPLTNSKSAVTSRISGLATGGDTFIPGGLTWGWNVLAAGEPYDTDSVATLNANGGRKVLVLMTDGINALTWRTTNNDPDGGSNLGWLTGTSNPATPNGLTQDLCTEIKKDGIQIFTVLFDVKDVTTETMLKTCASSPSMAFNPTDSAGLTAAFGAIGNQLRTVKLTQ